MGQVCGRENMGINCVFSKHKLMTNNYNGTCATRKLAANPKQE
jgi:hypothetical protein